MGDSRWQTIRPENLTFMIRRAYSDLKFKILLSDIMKLWTVDGTAHDLLTMCQNENPLCEFEQSKVINNIFNLFDKNLQSLRVGEVSNKTRTLKMCSYVGNVPFNLSWCLVEQAPEALYREVTYPLLLTAQDLILRQDHLCRLIKQKDAELEVYLTEHGPPRWGKAKSDSELFVEKKFKAQTFVQMQQSSADPIACTSNSELLDILNAQLRHGDQRGNSCPDQVKTEPSEACAMSGMGKTCHSSNLPGKREETGHQQLAICNVKQENPEVKDEEKSSIPNGYKPKRRKKVKLNL